jgi:hypothetical protein
LNIFKLTKNLESFVRKHDPVLLLEFKT